MANTPYLMDDGDFQTTTLNGAITNVADTATIGTGLTIPATNGVLQIDYDSTEALGDANGPETVSYATYNSGTGALAGISRGLAGTTGVSHANGRSVQYGPSSLLLQALQDGTSTDINIAASVYKSADQDDITNATMVKVTFNSEDYDLGANFASNKFTAPVTGYYDVEAQITYENGTIATVKPIGIAIYVNGAIVRGHMAGTGGTATQSVNIKTTLYLTATDYVEIYAYHQNGDNVPDLDATDATFGRLCWATFHFRST